MLQKIYSFVKTRSSRELINTLLLLTPIGFIWTVVWGILLQQRPTDTMAFLFGLGFIMLMVDFFMIGLVMVLKKENPYTLTKTLFGMRFFSHGIWPQIIGAFIMFLAGASMVALVTPLVRLILSS